MYIIYIYIYNIYNMQMHHIPLSLLGTAKRKQLVGVKVFMSHNPQERVL